MPILQKGHFQIDYADSAAMSGSGPASANYQKKTVILIHSSVSSNRQWHSLTEELQEHYRVLALNLFGYGETTPWDQDGTQTLHDQAQLVLALYEELCVEERPVYLVGHSMGGSIAMKAALLMGKQVDKLILLEPNAFFLLRQNGRTEAFQEAQALRDYIKFYGGLGDWESAAERFADYWLGIGAWQVMPEKRKVAFVRSIPPVFYEWDTMDEETTMAEFARINAQTLVVYDGATQRPIREAAELMRNACPHWAFQTVSDGGHMAPLTHPELINPIVRRFFGGSALADSADRNHVPATANNMTQGTRLFPRGPECIPIVL